MKKVVGFLKDPFAFPILIVGAIYIFWRFTTPMGGLGDENYLAGLIIFGIYILMTILAKAASANWKLTVLFIVLALPLLFGTALYTTWFLSESQLFGLNSKTIFIIGILLATIYPVITLLSKPTSKNNKTSLVLSFSMIPILGANIVYPMNFYPTILDRAKLEDYTYYVALTSDWDNHSFHTFYKCRKWSLGCDYLYGSYSESIGKLIVDEQKEEVSLMGFRGLLYTDGDNPRYYAAVSTQLGNHIYSLSQECNNFNDLKGYYDCESFTYTLYECDLNNKSCNSLPIQYTHNDDRNYLWLEPDETTNEINLYEEDFETDEQTLIFTYGEHPRCYVGGCEILEK